MFKFSINSAFQPELKVPALPLPSCFFSRLACGRRALLAAICAAMVFPSPGQTQSPTTTQTKMPKTNIQSEAQTKAQAKTQTKTQSHNQAIAEEHTQYTQVPEDEAFKLKASYTTRANSGSDVYRSLGAEGGVPLPVTFQRKLDILVTPKGQAQTAQTDLVAAKKGATDQAADLKQAAESKVDWSGWAGQLADRWFANLKNLEYNSHRGWTTDRPALIQFTCHADGRITGIQLRQSCGNAAYDKMQIDALKRAVPIQAFPAGTKLTTYTLMQGWEAHPRKAGEQDYKPGSFGANIPAEKVQMKPVVPKAAPTAAGSSSAASTAKKGTKASTGKISKKKPATSKKKPTTNKISYVRRHHI